jgi:hypothetical protein
MGVRILQGQLKIDVMLKKKKLNEKELNNYSTELVIAEVIGSGTALSPCKRLSLSVRVGDTGTLNAKFIVYDKNQTPVMSTEYPVRAILRYNAIEVEDVKENTLSVGDETEVV